MIRPAEGRRSGVAYAASPAASRADPRQPGFGVGSPDGGGNDGAVVCGRRPLGSLALFADAAGGAGRARRQRSRGPPRSRLASRKSTTSIPPGCGRSSTRRARSPGSARSSTTTTATAPCGCSPMRPTARHATSSPSAEASVATVRDGFRPVALAVGVTTRARRDSRSWLPYRHWLEHQVALAAGEARARRREGVRGPQPRARRAPGGGSRRRS